MSERDQAASLASTTCPLHRAPRSVCACSTAPQATVANAGLVRVVQHVLAEHYPYDDNKDYVQRCFTCVSTDAYSNGVAIHQLWPCAAIQLVDAITPLDEPQPPPFPTAVEIVTVAELTQQIARMESDLATWDGLYDRYGSRDLLARGLDTAKWLRGDYTQAGRRELTEQKPTYQQDGPTSPSTGYAKETKT